MDYAFTKIVDDVPGSEGPVVDLQGRFFVVSPGRGSILQIDESAQTKREHANTGGVPAGLQVDRDNRLWVADMKLGLLRVTPEGQVEDVVREFEGAPMRGCNDCAFDPEGNLYITAPAGSNNDNPVGEIYCWTAQGQMRRLDGGYAFCNGIAVTADGSTLIVAETYTKSLWAYDIQGPGQVANKRLFAKLEDPNGLGPDGMDFDEEGFLLVAHFGGSSVDVFDPQGKLVERIGCPFAKVTNVHFGGPDGRTLYVTELSEISVWKTRWRRAGQPGYAFISSNKS